MRVHIGDYIEWVGPYQIAEKIFFWVKKYDDKFDYTKEYDRVHEFGRWLSENRDGKDSWITKVCRWIHSKRKRKIKIKIDDFDVWSADRTLALIVLPVLKKIREDKHGSPGGMPAFQQTSNSSSQYTFEFYAEGDDNAWEEGHKQWIEILDKMIWSFEQIQPDYDWEAQYWRTSPEFDFEVTPVKYAQGDLDLVGMKSHSDKIQEGIELFGEYYQNLWT